MIRTLQRGRAGRLAWTLYTLAFFLFLFAPLGVAAVFAFNDSNFPTPPWRGFTFDWFVGDGTGGRRGVLFDPGLRAAFGVSFRIAVAVTLLSLVIGTCNAFLLERYQFRGKTVLAIVMLWPLVIPGVILGISILAFFSVAANHTYDVVGYDIEALRPGLPLVVLGQFSFICTMATLILLARLRKFDRTLEEAAFNLGAGRVAVFWTVTLPFLRPALVGAGVVAFLMSFENFNTTLMLVGSKSPLTIEMYGRMRQGATPALNAVSLVLIAASAVLALVVVAVQGREKRA